MQSNLRDMTKRIIWNIFFISSSKICACPCSVVQPCLTLCNPTDCSPTGSSVHGILQARILEWVAISSSRGSSQSRDQTRVSRIAGRHYNLWAIREARETKLWFFLKHWLPCAHEALNLHLCWDFSTLCEFYLNLPEWSIKMLPCHLIISSNSTLLYL